MFKDFQTQNSQEALDSAGQAIVSDAMGQVMGVMTSPIGTLKSLGVLGTNTAYDVGQAAIQAQFQHGIDEWANPWRGFWSNFRSGLEGDFGHFYFENRAGGYIGKNVGGAIGWVVGLWAPALQPLFVELFGEAGGMIGTFISSTYANPVEHPDVPGSPWDSTQDAPTVPSGHDPTWFENTIPETDNVTGNPHENINSGLTRKAYDKRLYMRKIERKMWHFM